MRHHPVGALILWKIKYSVNPSFSHKRSIFY